MCVLAACLLAGTQVFAGNISGTITTATGGVIGNGTLTFTLSQPAVLAGTGLVSSQSVSCYTATSGAIVGVPDSVVLPVLGTNLASDGRNLLRRSHRPPQNQGENHARISTKPLCGSSKKLLRSIKP